MVSCIFKRVIEITYLHTWILQYDIPYLWYAPFACLLNLPTDLGNFTKHNCARKYTFRITVNGHIVMAFSFTQMELMNP